MQNRYVADIGDYVKLAILRRLCRDRTLGVAWWLYPDESHNADGGHREYLERPSEWEGFDSELFQALLKIENSKERNVSAIERTEVLPKAEFARELVPCDVRPFSARIASRQAWLARIKAKLNSCNLVFLDPDNGIAQNGLRMTQRRAGKSVEIDEIKTLQADNRATVVYHHQTRREGGHCREICTIAANLRSNGLQVAGALRAKPWSPRVFFILNGDDELCERAAGIAKRWNGWIRWFPGAEILSNSTNMQSG